MKARCLILAVLVTIVLAMSVQSAPAQQPDSDEQKQSPKMVKVVFVNASWREVFKWLVAQTGKRSNRVLLAASFTFVGPPDKEYTLAEAIAIINEGLAKHPQQFILIEHEKSSVSPHSTELLAVSETSHSLLAVRMSLVS